MVVVPAWMFSMHREGTRHSRAGADNCSSTHWGREVPRYQGVVDLGSLEGLLCLSQQHLVSVRDKGSHRDGPWA